MKIKLTLLLLCFCSSYLFTSCFEDNTKDGSGNTGVVVPEVVVPEVVVPEQIDKKDLNLRNGIFYRVNTDIPFDGIIRSERVVSEQNHSRFHNINRKRIEIGTYKNGKPHGTIRAFDLHSLLPHQERGLSEDNLKKITEDTREIRRYKDGVLCGKQEYYYPRRTVYEFGEKTLRSGGLRESIMYLDGDKHGRHTKYHELSYQLHEQTTKISSYNFKHNVLDGPFSTYHANGLHESGSYLNGKKDGPYRAYHPNGELDVSGSYLNDKKDGCWINFYSTGRKSKSFNYKNGILNGLCEIYYKKGQLSESGNYKDGKKEGLWIFYDENGNKLNHSGSYINGEKVVNGT